MLRSIPILQWDFILRHYLSPAFTTSALLDKSVHLWMMPRLLLLRWHLFRQMNSVLYGTALKQLQRVQCALARVVVNQRSRTPFSSNELLKQLHWLPLEWRIQFKLASLTFKALHTGRPPYLTDLLQHHQSTRYNVRSSSSHQLFIQRHNLSFGSRAFRFSAPWIWNKLSPHSRNPVTSCF